MANVVQSCRHVQLFVTPWTAAHQASLSFTISWSLLKLMSIESVMPSSHLILCVPFSSCLQSFLVSGSFPVSHLFASGGQIIGASASASVPPMDIWGDWFDLPAVQGTLKSLLQQYEWKASILHSAFFMVQLSHPYMTTGKPIAMTVWTSVGKVMSLLFDTVA